MNHETAIIGAALLDPAEVIPACQDKLTPAAFGQWEACAEAMYRLASEHGAEGVDIVTLCATLGDAWQPVLMGLMADVVTTAHVDKHITQLAEQHARRQIGETARTLYDKATEGESIDELHATARRIESIGVAADSYRHIRESGPASMSRIQAAMNPEATAQGVPSGISTIDHLLHRMAPGALIILAARPSIGKTAVGLQVALNAAEQTGVGYFSLEMDAESLYCRLLGNLGSVNMERVMRGDVRAADMQSITQAAEVLKDTPIFVDDSPRLTMAQIRARAQRMAKRDGVGIIMIDYLQLITAAQGKNQTRENVVASQSAQCKAMARELGVPVVLLAQLNRAAGDGRPSLHHLRESGAIEQDADAVMLLHREDRQAEPMEAIVAKHRNGPTGAALLKFCLATQRIEPRGRFDDEDI